MDKDKDKEDKDKEKEKGTEKVEEKEKKGKNYLWRGRQRAWPQGRTAQLSTKIPLLHTGGDDLFVPWQGGRQAGRKANYRRKTNKILPTPARRFSNFFCEDKVSKRCKDLQRSQIFEKTHHYCSSSKS